MRQRSSTILIKEFSRVLSHFCYINNITNEKEFENIYLNVQLDKIRDLMKLDKTKINQVDRILGQSLKYSILDSYEVQRMDGKGAYIIRKLIRAFVSNPQQLPNEYINRFVKVEIVRLLNTERMNKFIKQVRKEFRNIPDNLNVWKDYECREILRLITNDEGLFNEM